MPEKEYIEREAVINKLKEKMINSQTAFINTVLIGLLKEAPTADVAEVKHGKWLYVSGVGRYAEYECSECKAHVCFDEKIDGTIPVYNGCPHCLAKMDGKEKKDA